MDVIPLNPAPAVSRGDVATIAAGIDALREQRDDLAMAISDFLWALDRGHLSIDRPDSAFVSGLRDQLAKARTR